MNNSEKVSFDELIEHGDFVKSEKKSDEKIFKDTPRKHDFTIPVLCVIAAIFICACAYYSYNAYSKINNTIKVSGQTAESHLETVKEQYKDGKVNINTAGIEVLCTLKDIGETRALEIMTYREVNGPFKSIEDLKKVKGIGETTYKNIKNNICV